MTTFRSCSGSYLAGVGILTLLGLLMLVNAAYGGEAYCDACKGDSGLSGQKALEQIGNPNAGNAEVLPGLSTAQKNRVGVWKQSLAGFNESNVSESPVAEKTEQRKPSEENASIVRSARAMSMLAPINEATDSPVLLDISENATEHIPGSVAISYADFLNGTDVRSMAELAQMLGDAGFRATQWSSTANACLVVEAPLLRPLSTGS